MQEPRLVIVYYESSDVSSRAAISPGESKRNGLFVEGGWQKISRPGSSQCE